MQLRLAEPSDAMTVARLHVRSWQAAYRGLLPDEYLDELRPEERAAWYDFTGADSSRPTTIVAVGAGSILGFATTQRSRDPDAADCGELCALYIDPSWWGRGTGTALAAAARSQLTAQGFECALAWVLDGHERAARFYCRDRWIPDGACRTTTIWGIAVHEVRYRQALGPVSASQFQGDLRMTGIDNAGWRSPP